MTFVDAIVKPTAWYVARNEKTMGKHLRICVVTNLVVLEIILYDQTFANEVVGSPQKLQGRHIASWGWRAPGGEIRGAPLPCR